MDLFSILDSILSPSALMINCVEKNWEGIGLFKAARKGDERSIMNLFVKKREASSEGLYNFGSS